MSTPKFQQHSTDNVVTRLPVADRRILTFIRQHARIFRALAIGLVLAVGSSGLLLGAVTVAVSSLLVDAGVGLLGAMTFGFFSTGLVGAGLGIYIAMRSIRALTDELPADAR